MAIPLTLLRDIDFSQWNTNNNGIIYLTNGARSSIVTTIELICSLSNSPVAGQPQVMLKINKSFQLLLPRKIVSLR